MPARFTFHSAHAGPILHRASAGAEDNRYGFEGGTIMRRPDGLHLFTTEMCGAPKWLPTRLAHWHSADGLAFTRVSTLFTSTANFDGTDPRASLWSPMPLFNPAEDRWNLTYVCYRCAPNTAEVHWLHHHGYIQRARSTVPGLDGIAGPYEDADILLAPGPDSDPWEGLQGVDSFFAYPTSHDTWHAFYGSCHTQKRPIAWWGVGLATAPALAGPWKRCSALNPVLLDPTFTENPIVTRLADGTFVAVYDSTLHGTFGLSTSADGVNWNPGELIDYPRDAFPWLAVMRTPLCLLPGPDDTLLLYFTGYDDAGEVAAEDCFASEAFGCLGLLRLRAL